MSCFDESCPQLFPTSEERTRHVLNCHFMLDMNRKHSEVNCEWKDCSKSFPSKDLLSRHVIVDHIYKTRTELDQLCAQLVNYANRSDSEEK